MKKEKSVNDRLNNEKKLSYLFILPAVVILFGVSIIPLLYSIGLSMTDFTFGAPETHFIGLRNYLSAFQDEYFRNGLKLTSIFVLGSTVASFIFGLFISLLLHADFKGSSFVKTIVLAPMCLPSVVVGIMWILMLMPDFSIVNYFLGLFGITPPQWLLTPGWALVAVMMAYVWQWTPFFTLMIYAGLVSLPAEPYEAALVDGASWPQMLRYITLPLLKPIILLTVIIRMVDAFKVFDQVFIMTYGGPGISTQVLSFTIYLNGIRYRYLGYASAMSWLMIIILIVLSMFLIKALRQVRT